MLFLPAPPHTDAHAHTRLTRTSSSCNSVLVSSSYILEGFGGFTKLSCDLKTFTKQPKQGHPHCVDVSSIPNQFKQTLGRHKDSGLNIIVDSDTILSHLTSQNSDFKIRDFICSQIVIHLPLIVLVFFCTSR